MVEQNKSAYKYTFIRGATTANGNSVAEIENAVVELIDELISRNKLLKKKLIIYYFYCNKRFRCMFSCFNS